MAQLNPMMRAAFATLVALAAIALPGAANAVERKLLVASFDNIVVIGDVTVIVQTGRAVSGIANGDQRMLDSLKLERTGNTLRVRLQNIINNDNNRPITQRLRVVLTTQQIRDITLSGNGDVTVNNIDQAAGVRILVAGGGRVSIGNLRADQFAANINGNGQIQISSGSVRDSRVTISGAGEYQAANLQSRKLRLEHNGNASSSASASEEAQIFNRGSGNINIGGAGTCFIKAAGGASIKCTKIDGVNKKR